MLSLDTQLEIWETRKQIENGWEICILALNTEFKLNLVTQGADLCKRLYSSFSQTYISYTYTHFQCTLKKGGYYFCGMKILDTPKQAGKKKNKKAKQIYIPSRPSQIIVEYSSRHHFLSQSKKMSFYSSRFKDKNWGATFLSGVCSVGQFGHLIFVLHHYCGTLVIQWCHRQGNNAADYEFQHIDSYSLQRWDSRPAPRRCWLTAGNAKWHNHVA